MTTFVVTGGAGFIGSHVVTHLLDRGHRVRAFDSFRTGKRGNLAHLAGRGGWELLEGSVTDDAALAGAFAGAEVVVHLAAQVSVPESVADPLTCHAINATGTLGVLRAAAAAGVRRVVYAGSSSAYGDSPAGPIRETHPPIAASPYAAAKLAGEMYCTAFAGCTSLETVRLRFFNVFGPRQDPSSPYSGVIAIFLTRMLAGQAPTIYGDGQQARDFVYVGDVADAVHRAATVPGASGGVFNVGRGERQTLLDLVATINRVLGTDLAPRFADPRPGDVRESRADIAAARAALGFEPRVSFADGLAACVEFYRGQGGMPGGS